MLVRALSSDCMVERYSVSLKETCGKRKFSVLEAREFIHVRLHTFIHNSKTTLYKAVCFCLILITIRRILVTSVVS